MTDSTPPAAATPSTALVADPPADPHRVALQEHGFDLADYDWLPVRRVRTRTDGWTPSKQRRFIEVLADTCSVRAAAAAVEMSVQTAYRLRRLPTGAGFARAWEAAIHEGAQRLEDVAFERAIDGVDRPVFDRDGQRVGARRVYSDRLLMFLLGTHRPDRYGRAPTPVRVPVADALHALTPAAPPEPHRLMPPEALVDALRVADIAGGDLPHWLREPLPDAEERDDPDRAAHVDALLDRLRAAGDDRDADGRNPM